MNALLIVAHGSRKPDANQALLELAAQVQALGGQHVRCAFLQFGQPDLPAALADLVESGCKAITIIPLVLTAGKHLEEDIGTATDNLRRAHPELTVILSPHLGAWSGLPRAILDLAGQV